MYWYDKAVESLEEDLELGYITQDEYNKEMRNLNAELLQLIQEAAEERYNEFIMGN